MPRTKAPEVILADFETRGIQPRPKYPPKPVSLALKWPGQREYMLMSWGHEAGGNNCTEREARGAYKKARDSKYGMCFQYGEFDQDVAETHWEIPLLPYERYHDTLFLLFLWDPHADGLGLKPSAERLLGMAPEEQDRLKEWILANVPEARRRPSEWGAHIWRAPYQVVRPYHKGDLVRTGALFDWLWPRVVDAGMGAAYERERKLMPILLRNARRGMRVDSARLERDLPAMRAGLDKVDAWLRRRLGRPDMNLNSDRQLGDALYEKGVVTEFAMTRGGDGKAPQRSVSKKSLTIDRFKDRKVYQALTYRSQMSTSVDTFMGPWTELIGDGDVLYPNWSQVRAPKGGGSDTSGARSGRIICSKPNLLNIPKKWKKAVVAGYVHPAFVRGLPELPFMRTYVLPHLGRRWGRRDYNQQEVRLFAHYEEGPVYEGFMADPRFDMHEGVRRETEAALVESGLREEFDRDSAKTGVFGAFYGQGFDGLMESLKLRRPDDDAVGRIIHRALHRAAPSIKELSGRLKELANDASYGPRGGPIKTWGGRLYYKEPSKYVEKFGRDMDFAYKLISYLIQGSGADVIKEAIVRWDADPRRGEDLIVTVYDEVNIDLPPGERGARHEMTVLKECMQSIEADVPMLSDGETGDSWGALKAYAV